MADLLQPLAQLFGEKWFGSATRLVESSVAVGGVAPATEILINNPDRVFWQIQNRGTVDLFLGFSRQVSTTNGIRVLADGGTASMAVQEDGEAVTQSVFAIGNGVAVTVYVLEVRRP